ncbi:MULTISPECIES: DarT ssDNA thymidine ADP-ribosyltransferase family protein [unclassified Leclercia]|uniref:DUF4433 domain-containing protein n=1 Tax=Leclercia barmai TaxID=2785629 RepID=A0ABS7S0V5_9ENTR|nr:MULTISPECIES: DarT ssDNA thymidine ADP-ribosyltransferase family protein [unclassified Leclercia]MBZ0059768.1 DUF4433 domain-containing protein [Leclercia sp. EMC7]MCM5695082.1 DUF4433 domain-containing protein [Leclercia sp. LTM01]MCM5699491.1 DUF4433 domain-containing protein [Leclercia sp. LTM14]
MWTVIGILFVLGIIGNAFSKKKTPPARPKFPPTVVHPEAPPKIAPTLVVAPTPVISPDVGEVRLERQDAIMLLSQVTGLKELLLTRYALTGLTRLSPAYASDLHFAFMRELRNLHFYAIQNYDWRNLIDYTSIKRKPISALYHFTHISNLQSILEHGILTRQQLESSDQPFYYNDNLRLDGVRDSISLSVGHVNNKMLYKYTQGLNDHEWVILKIKTELITGPLSPSFDHTNLLNRNVYCRHNAASSGVTSISIAERQTYSAFNAMFVGDNGEEHDLPVDVQSEILHLGTIPTHFISELIFYGQENVPAWLNNLPQRIVVDPSRFSFR